MHYQEIQLGLDSGNGEGEWKGRTPDGMDDDGQGTLLYITIACYENAEKEGERASFMGKEENAGIEGGDRRLVLYQKEGLTNCAGKTVNRNQRGVQISVDE